MAWVLFGGDDVEVRSAGLGGAPALVPGATLHLYTDSGATTPVTSPAVVRVVGGGTLTLPLVVNAASQVPLFEAIDTADLWYQVNAGPVGRLYPEAGPILEAVAPLTAVAASPYLVVNPDVYRLPRTSIGTSDDTAAVTAVVAAAVADGISKVLLPPGRININNVNGSVLGSQVGGTPLSAGGLDIAGYGEDTEIRYTNATASGAGCFNVAGSESATTALAVDALAGASSITLPALVAAALVPGSVICLESDIHAFAASTLAGAVPIRAKEMREVLSVSGTTVVLDGMLIWDYPVAQNAVVSIVTMVRGVRIRDLLFTSADDSVTMKQYAIRLRWCQDAEISGITMRRGPGGLSLFNVLGVNIADVHVDGLPSHLDAWGYGITLSGPSAHVDVDNLHGRNFRHLFTTGHGSTTVTGGLGFGGGPRQVTVRNGVGEGSDFSIWDTHHPGWDISFVNCKAIGGAGASAAGFQIRSRKTRLVGCSSYRSGVQALRMDQFADDLEVIGGEFAYAAATSGVNLASRAAIRGAHIHHNVGPGVNLLLSTGGYANNLLVQDCHIHDNTYGVSDQTAGTAESVVIGPGNVIAHSATQTISLLNLTAGTVAFGNHYPGYTSGTDGSSGSSSATRVGNLLPGGTLQGVGGQAADVQRFTSSGTWTKPAGAKSVEVQGVGVGGSGGSGRRGADGANRFGGGGGGGAPTGSLTFDASALASTVTVTVGTVGTPGPAITTDDTDGTAATASTSSSFGSMFLLLPGNAGAAGTATTGTGGVATGGHHPGGAGGSSSASATPTTAASAAGAPGGGAGGGRSSANVSQAGGKGGASQVVNVAAANGGTAPGGAGTAGTSQTAGIAVPGIGASAGAAGDGSTAGGAGGAGGTYGAGGAGGGAGVNGNNSGAGGAGGPGIVVVTTYF